MSTDLATTAHTPQPGQIQTYTPAQIDLIRNVIAPNSTDDELKLFVAYCKRTQLDPFTRQIYAIKRKTKDEHDKWVEKLTIQVGIDGFRLMAERTGKYGGQLGPYWCGADGQWVDAWLGNDPPVAAKVGIIRTDFKEPVWAIARFDSYAQRKADGKLMRMWATMGEMMIAKCAEALGHRKAFPQEMSGIYTDDELAHLDNEPPRSAGQQRPALVVPSKEDLESLMKEKNWEWNRLLSALDKKLGTDHKKRNSTYEQLDPAILADFYAWLKTEQPWPATTSAAPTGKLAAVNALIADLDKLIGADATNRFLEREVGGDRAAIATLKPEDFDWVIEKLTAHKVAAKPAA